MRVVGDMAVVPCWVEMAALTLLAAGKLNYQNKERQTAGWVVELAAQLRLGEQRAVCYRNCHRKWNRV